MIPTRLRLSGFLSYQEPVELDFTSFDLACISGTNGAGKSSLLDAITWALFGQARRRDDALINSHAQAAEVTFDFYYENNLYRVVRAKPREKTALLEFYICAEDGKWRPLTEKSIRETENRIQSTLRMDYDTFTNASFLLQGRADQFAQQRPGERKRVLAAILGLEVWELYRAEAIEQRKALEVEMRSIEAQLEDIEAELNQEEARKLRLSEAEARLEQLNQLRQAREAGLASLRRLEATLNEQRRLVDVLARGLNETRSRYERISADLERLREERARFEQALADEAQAQADYRRWMELRAELERWDAVAANFREIEARRAGPLTAIAAEASRIDQERRTLLQQELAAKQEQERLPELEAQRVQAAEAVKALEAQLETRRELEAGLRETQGRAAEALAENRSLRQKMNELKERIDRLEEVEGALCPLCGQPLSPEDRARLIEQLQVEGKEMGDLYRANLDLKTKSDEQVRELQQQIAAMARVDDELRIQSRQLDRIEAEYARIVQASETWQAGGAARLAEVTRMLAEEDFAHEARQELAVIDAESKALGYDSAAHDEARRAEQEGRSVEARIRAIEVARASLAPLERQIAGLEQQAAQEKEQLDQQETAFAQAREKYEEEAAQLPDINQAERDLFEIVEEENRLRLDVGMLRQLVEVLNTQRSRRKRLAAQRDRVAQQIGRLKTLERAFSKDGVPALLIEQALPEIEAQANELLDRLSGGTMSIHFETQRQYKDKNRDDRRETLDIIISDPAGQREYEMFSGGEVFRVNFAIRLALSRLLAQRAGARLQTLVIDEGFGSQDAQGRQRLIEAINLVRHEFKKILVITHMEELKEAFPARIEVEKTLHGSTVRVIA
ncbi:MAG: SMC family ATPase [Chloroflexi bacterium]|nr:SMC family ATPase [Chloroflexota bacterium]